MLSAGKQFIPAPNETGYAAFHPRRKNRPICFKPEADFALFILHALMWLFVAHN